MSWLRRRRRHGAEVVDLTEPPVLGQPGRCPRCGGGAYLDQIDLTRHQQHEHCRGCGHRWAVDITAAERAAKRGGDLPR